MKFKPALLVMALMGAGASFTAWSEPLALISNAEAQLPNAKSVTTRAITRGPGIKLVSPTDVSAASFSFKVAFEPRGGAKIDPQSVHVEYMKEPAVDLTPRLSAGLKGDQIDLPQVSVPKGVHQLRISAKDSEGRSTTTVVSLNAQ